VDGGAQLALKIAHFPDCVAAGYLEKKNTWASSYFVCGGGIWNLSINLRDAEGQLAHKVQPPKHLGVYLNILQGCW
jgi:hypothetical protein